jgi:hypothetical protein
VRREPARSLTRSRRISRIGRSPSRGAPGPDLPSVAAILDVVGRMHPAAAARTRVPTSMSLERPTRAIEHELGRAGAVRVDRQGTTEVSGLLGVVWEQRNVRLRRRSAPLVEETSCVGWEVGRCSVVSSAPPGVTCARGVRHAGWCLQRLMLRGAVHSSARDVDAPSVDAHDLSAREDTAHDRSNLLILVAQ